MNDILKFLSDNYIYVTGIGLILIIILIGFLANRRKERKVNTTDEKEAMVNINDVQTGAISQVAENLNTHNEVPAAPIMPTSDALVVEKEPVIPVMNEVNEVKPVEERFEKTEIMDFSDINGHNNIIKPSDVATFTPDASQYSEGNILNGEETTTQTDDQSKPL